MTTTSLAHWFTWVASSGEASFWVLGRKQRAALPSLMGPARLEKWLCQRWALPLIEPGGPIREGSAAVLAAQDPKAGLT